MTLFSLIFSCIFFFHLFILFSLHLSSIFHEFAWLKFFLHDFDFATICRDTFTFALTRIGNGIGDRNGFGFQGENNRCINMNALAYFYTHFPRSYLPIFIYLYFLIFLFFSFLFFLCVYSSFCCRPLGAHGQTLGQESRILSTLKARHNTSRHDTSVFSCGRYSTEHRTLNMALAMATTSSFSQ